MYLVGYYNLGRFGVGRQINLFLMIRTHAQSVYVKQQKHLSV